MVEFRASRTSHRVAFGQCGSLPSVSPQLNGMMTYQNVAELGAELSPFLDEVHREIGGLHVETFAG
jgi:hypothetical protein